MTNCLLFKMAIEIVDLPIYPLKKVIFPSVFCMFTRGYQIQVQKVATESKLPVTINEGAPWKGASLSHA